MQKKPGKLKGRKIWEGRGKEGNEECERSEESERLKMEDLPKTDELAQMIYASKLYI